MKTICVSNHDRPHVNLELVVRGGALADPPGCEGLAYLTARMLLRGTQRRDHGQLTEAVEHLGSTLDAGTSQEWLSLHGDALTRNLPAFVDLFQEVVAEPSFPEAELEKLRRQTLAQLQSLRDSDEWLARLFFFQALCAGSPFGRSIYGTEASLARLGCQQVRDFYGRYCHGDGLLLAASGDILRSDLDRIGDAIRATLPASGPLLPDPVLPVSQPGRRLVLVDKPERCQTQILIGHMSIPAAHPDYFDLLVATTAFGGTFTSRLSQEIREKRGWSYGAYSVLGVDRQTGSFVARINPQNENAAAAVDLTLHMLEDWVGQGLSDDETAFAQSFLMKNFPFHIETPSKRLQQAVACELLGRPADYLDTWRARVAAVTTESANAALLRHIHPRDLLILVVCTADGLADSLGTIPGVSDMLVHPYDRDWGL